MDTNRSKEFTEKNEVDVNEKWERDYWSDKWGVTNEELLEAVAETGTTDVDTLEKYLINKKIEE